MYSLIKGRHHCTLVIVTLLLLGAACGQPPSPAEVSNGTSTTAPTLEPTPATVPPTPSPKVLRVGGLYDISNLDPALRPATIDAQVAQMVLSGLLRYAPNSFDPVLDLAESVEWSEDGKTISFKLKEGVMWPNGYGEVTAEDVKYSFERMIDPELQSAYAADWATLDQVEVVDRYSGNIILNEVMPSLWTVTLPGASGLVVPEEYLEEVGPEVFSTQPLGTGPYMISEWEPGVKVVLKRNPDYFEPALLWDEIQILVVMAESADILLESKEVDFVQIRPHQADLLETRENIEVLRAPALGYNWIGMNVENPKLQDINVRRAIRYALDVPAILTAQDIKAERARCLIPPGILGHWEDGPLYERDVVRAKEYLAEAGIESLELRIDVTSDKKMVGEVVQQNLNDIGINVAVNPLDPSSFWGIGMEESGKELELFHIGYSMEPDPASATEWFTCNQIGEWNWMRWCNEEYDELHAKAMAIVDEDERRELYVRMQQLFDTGVHTIFTTHGTREYAYYPDIVKPALTPGSVQQLQYFEPVITD